MCGRFEAFFPDNKMVNPLENIFNNLIIEDTEEDDLKIFDIRPTNKILCIYKDGEKNKITNANWGIQFSPKSHLIINSRIETIREKPFWFKSFDKNRALVPMSAFYEWIYIDGKKKQQRIYIEGVDVFYVPSIYYKKNDELFVSFITVPSNKFMKKLHPRMPVILIGTETINYLTDEAEANLAKCKSLSDDVIMNNEPFKAK